MKSASAYSNTSKSRAALSAREIGIHLRWEQNWILKQKVQNCF